MTLGQVLTALGSPLESGAGSQLYVGLQQSPSSAFTTRCGFLTAALAGARARYGQDLNTGVTTGAFQRDWNYFAAQLNCAGPYPAAGQPIGGGSDDTMRDAERIVTAVTTSLGGTPLMGAADQLVDPTDPTDPTGSGGDGPDPTNPDQSPTPLELPPEQAEQWTQVAGTTAPSRVLTLAMAQRSQNVNVGALVIPVQVGSTIANRASWSDGGGWQIPTCREQFPFGCIDRAAVDEDVTIDQIDRSRVANQMGVTGSGMTGGTGGTGGTGMMPVGGGIPIQTHLSLIHISEPTRPY